MDSSSGTKKLTTIFHYSHAISMHLNHSDTDAGMSSPRPILLTAHSNFSLALKQPFLRLTALEKKVQIEIFACVTEGWFRQLVQPGIHLAN